ncbi:MAG: VWA domain-containing protein [Pirellulaceae bacterium]
MPCFALLLADIAPWQQTLLRWLGYDFSQSPADARPEWQWTNLPASWGVFVLIAVVAAVVWGVFAIYRREIDTCPRWVKRLLATLRAAVVLLLTCIFLGPSLVYLQQRTIQPSVVLLRDASQSMNTADAYENEADSARVAAALGQSASQIQKERPTRTHIVNQVLAHQNGRLLSELSARGKVEALNFADQVTKVDLRIPPPVKGAAKSDEVAPTLPLLVAAGRGSDLWTALRQSLSSDSPAAIVLFTDGQHTGQDDPRSAAREAKERGVPLLVVGVGDPSRPRNLKVANVFVRPQVWQDEPFEVDAPIAAEGIDANEVRVELVEQRVDDNDAALGSGTVVQSVQVALNRPGERPRAQFSHTSREAGRYVYSVRAEALEGEQTEADNEYASPVVKVLSREKVRVLLVAGAPTWEYRLVQKLLSRDKTMTVSCWLQTLDEERAQEGTRPITRLPITKEELFYYDVLLLFDPNPQEFDQAWIELVKQFVGEHSGGLLFMAGPKHSGRLLTNARTAEFATLLPVSFGDVGALEVAALLSSNQRAWPLKVVPANADHPTMRFYPERQETLRRWETLPGIFWSFPSKDAKPTAQVLLEHGDPTLRSVEGSRPLLVAGRYGSGHTLYLGFNGTWRWRRAGRQAEFFDKFWIQSIRYLVEGRSLEGRRRGYVQTERDRYEIGEKVTITARLQDATFSPLVAPKIDASVQVGSDTPVTVPLVPVANQPGQYEASLTPRQTGLHKVRLSVPASEAEGGVIATDFSVDLPSVETNQVWLNKPLLMDLASLSGGQYFNIDELGQLPAAVPDKSEIVEVRSKPDPLWDVRGMLFALVGLLGCEWFLRKRYKLL